MNALANASPPTLLLLLPAAASVQVKAIQPLDRWWQTGWLYVVVAALGCGLIALIYLAKLRQRQTEQTLAARLQASEARFARIFRTSPVAMILLRTKSGHIVDINPAWSQLVGYSAEEAIGRTTIELGVVDEAARQYLVSNLSDQRSVRNLETTIRTRTNQPLQVLISTELFDIDGEPGRLATIIDITERKQAEEKSRTAAEHFAIVFHRSPVPMSLVRMADNVYLEANDSFLRLVECTLDEVIGHTSLELNLIDVEDQAKNIRVFNQPNGPSHIEVRGRTKSGRLLTVLVSSEKTELAGEVCWITTMLDISERKQIEDALQEREHFLSHILSTSPAIVYIYDFEIQANVYANVGLERILGYTVAEIQAMSANLFTSLIHPDDRPAVSAFQQQVKAAGDEDMPEVEYRMRHADGSWRILRCVERPFMRHEDGSPKQKIGVALDVTDRHQAEAERDAIFQRNQTLVRALGQIVYEWRPPLDEIEWHGDYEGILGYTPAEMGHNTASWTARVHPDDLARVLQEVDDASQEKRRYSLEYRFLHRDGSYRWMYDQGILTFDNQDGLERIIGVFRDISARKALEEQLYQARKMEAIGRLAGGIAHDFNNILVPILGYADLGMRRLPPDDRLYNYLKMIHEAADRAAGLTHQILAFSRRQVLEMELLDLNTVVAKFEKMIRHLIGEDIVLQTFLEADLYRVKADRGQIEQVLMNLAINARDAMPNGGQLTIETTNTYLDEAYVAKHTEAQPPGYYAMLAVSDTGCGMDAETQQQIFEPFFTTKKPGAGTGLGLATVFGIIKQHQGNIWVYSEPENGASFRIYLPKTREDVFTPNNLPPLTSLYGTETILVVEDEDMVRKLAVETLEAHGYHVLEAPTPKAGIQQVAEAKAPIDLLLTDVIMPEMNGLVLYQNVVALQPDIKVLYMSGYTDNIIVHHGILDEGVNFLQKPFTVQSLTRIVRQVLG